MTPQSLYSLRVVPLLLCSAALYPATATTVLAQTPAPDHSLRDTDWNRFRGPTAQGVAADNPNLPTTWSQSENIQWQVDVPGWGWSCPIVVGDRVWLTTVVSDSDNEEPKKGLYLGQGVREPAKGNHKWLVICYDLKSGKELWQRVAHEGKPTVPRHPKSTYASETPTTDGQRLYVLFGDVGLFCYDLDGNLLWKHPIRPRRTMADYGAAASPVVHGNQVFVVYDNQEDSFVASFDTESGEQIWRRQRNEKSTWATPYIWEQAEQTMLVVCGKQENVAYDMQGDVIWHFDGAMSNLVIPSPFAVDDLLYITSGYIGDAHRPVYAVRSSARGNISLADGETNNSAIAWYLPKAGPYNPSPIVYQGRYYTLFDRGFMTCHDAVSGAEVYGRTPFARGATFTASPWAYNGMLFFLSEDGDTYVVRAGEEFELLATNSLDELCLATPAVSGGRLLIRTASKLYCISSQQ